MDNDSIAEQIVNSLSFEVVAVPRDNILQLTTTTKAAPLNVRIRVRKKDVAEFNNGVISLPNKRPDNVPERVRLVSSDQTIMSFNIVMEADFQKSAKKRRNFWGIFKPNRNAPSADGRKKYFFGRCKPGGCMDPPFGEDRSPYSPAIVDIDKEAATGISRNDAKGHRRTSSLINKLSNNKKISGEMLDNNVIQKDTKTESVVDLYKAESEGPYSNNSIMTYPPTNSNEQQEDKRGSRIYTNPSKNSFDQSGRYFIIPKKAKNVLEKNSNIKDESYSKTRDLKLETLDINKEQNEDEQVEKSQDKYYVTTEQHPLENSISNKDNYTAPPKDHSEPLTDFTTEKADELNEQQTVKPSISDESKDIKIVPIPILIPIPVTKQDEKPKTAEGKDFVSTEQQPVESSIADDPNSIPTLITAQTGKDEKGIQLKESQDAVTEKQNSKFNNVLGNHKSSSVDNLDDDLQSNKGISNKDSFKDDNLMTEQKVSENQPEDKNVSIGHEFSTLDLTDTILQEKEKSAVKNIDSERLPDKPTNEGVEVVKPEDNNSQHLWENKNDPITSDIKLKDDNEVGKVLDQNNDTKNIDNEQTPDKSNGSPIITKESDFESQTEKDFNNLDLPNEMNVTPEDMMQNDNQIDNSVNKIQIDETSNMQDTTDQFKVTGSTDLLEQQKPSTFENNETTTVGEDKHIQEPINESKTTYETGLIQNYVKDSTGFDKYDKETELETSNEHETKSENETKENGQRDSFDRIDDQIKSTENDINEKLNINDQFASQIKDFQYVDVKDSNEILSESKPDIEKPDIYKDTDTKREGETEIEQNPLIEITEGKTKPTTDEAINENEQPDITDKMDISKDSALYEDNNNISSPPLVDTSNQQDATKQNQDNDKHITFDNEIKVINDVIKSCPEETPSKKEAPIAITIAVQVDMERMIVKSLDPDNLPTQYPRDSVKIAKGFLNTDEEIKLAIDPDNDLYIQIRSNSSNDNKDGRNEYNANEGIIKTTVIDNSKQNPIESDFGKQNVITVEDLRKTLEGVYENELLPLKNNIAELQNDIEMLTKQHMLINGHMYVRKTRSTRIVPIFKKCACSRKFTQ